MATLKVQTGPYELLASATYLTLLEEAIKVELEITPGEKFFLSFIFSDKDGVAESSIEPRVIDVRSLEVKLNNFKSLGTGNSVPWEVGILNDGRSLFINLKGSRQPDSKIHELVLSFYAGPSKLPPEDRVVYGESSQREQESEERNIGETS